jgi:putative acetyltransferase
VLIVEASASDLEDALAVSRVAFGGEDVPTLVRDLVADPSSRPLLSLIALDDGRTIGHALFSAARVEAEEDSASAVILGPLAVVPAAQRKGVGGLLIEAGLRLLGESGIGLVFLAGDPRYYDRHGFEPAHRHGLVPPFSVTPEEAWMVRALTPDALGVAAGAVICADVLNKAEHWRE